MAITRYTTTDNQTLAWSSVTKSNGDLAIIIVVNDGSLAQSTPSQYTRFDPDVNNGTTVQVGAYYRIIDGSESGNAYAEGDFGISSEGDTSCLFIVPAAEWDGTAPPECTKARATSASANPPSLTVSWGAVTGNIWLIAFAIDGGDHTITTNEPTPPADYSTNYLFQESDVSLGAAELGTSWRTTDSATEDPATATLVVSDEEWIALTIGIKPAGGGGVEPQVILPDADITTTGWSSTPLWSKIDEADGTTITATAS